MRSFPEIDCLSMLCRHEHEQLPAKFGRIAGVNPLHIWKDSRGIALKVRRSTLQKMTTTGSLEDVLNDSDLAFFKEADSCLLVTNPNCILPVRDQGKSNFCTGFVVTATMYADEVARNGSSQEGSVQELMDYVHWYKRPFGVGSEGPFTVPPQGFGCDYITAFKYIKRHGLCPKSIYPWVGTVRGYVPTDPKQPIMCDRKKGKWDGAIEVGTRKVQYDEKIQITTFSKVKTLEDVEKFLDKQPVTGVIVAAPEFMDCNNGDVLKYDRPSVCMGYGKHSVTLVGYGLDDSDKYYIVQNSHGLDWGYRGYCKIRSDLVMEFYVPVHTKSPGDSSGSTSEPKS